MMKTSNKAYQLQQAAESEERANLLVGTGLKLEGSINACDRMEVQGHVDAKIEAREFVVSRGGQVVGTVSAESATVEGLFDGTLEVTGCIHIKKSGRVSGTIKYGQLEIEKGGQIRGDVQQMDDAKEAKKSTATPGANGIRNGPAKQPKATPNDSANDPGIIAARSQNSPVAPVSGTAS